MTESTLEAITRDDLVSYHDTYFRPNAAYLIVVGDITPDDAYAKANTHFGKWKAFPRRRRGFGASTNG